jgi:hypothetical protein
MRHGKAEASASPAVGRAVQGDNVQGNGMQDDSIAVPPLDALRP